MHSDNLEMPMYNLNGALIFTVYVISALLLTLFITSHLFATYQRQSATERKKRDSLGQGKQLYLFSALSTLSFSILSYHMLSYLILSYRSWAIQKNIPLPQKLIGQNSLLGPGIDRVQLQIWHWLTTSTLFLAFAQTICSTFARYWWIQQALLWTMLWNLFLNVQGNGSLPPHPSLYWLS